MPYSYRDIITLEHKVKNALGPMDTLNYTNVYEFEKLTDGLEDAFHIWSVNNIHYALYMSAAYMVAMFAGQKYMSTRKSLELRPALVVWNAILAAFSICGAWRMVPDLLHSITNYSYYHSVCHPNYFQGVTGFWAIAFVLSKPWELGDTIFIILRKQPLIFLHWYHHMSVLVYAWYIFAGHEAGARWGMSMNYFVHSLMYTYYALRAMRFRPPRWVSVFLTAIQIVQMIAGFGMCVYLYFVMRAGIPCQASETSLFIGLVMYFSYLLLFVHYFVNSYLRPKPQQRPAAKEEAKVASEVRSVIKSVADIERSGYVKKDN